MCVFHGVFHDNPKSENGMPAKQVPSSPGNNFSSHLPSRLTELLLKGHIGKQKTMSDMQGSGSTPFTFYAFYQLYAHFNNEAVGLTFDTIKSKIYPRYALANGKEKEHSSLFVTWKKLGMDKTYQLRGCIGTFSKLPLLRGIEKYSLIAALQDSRFSPIGATELPKLKCSCNILSNFKSIYADGTGDIYDWKIGKHGVELLFTHPKTGKTCSATFLPEVMEEHNWTQIETFENLIEKAGCWQYVEQIMENYDQYFIEVIKYEGDKSELTYDEFESLLSKV
ncbi:uncharacterized protein Ecym_6257 [Eremothecium cymbalariae DBVPG|uniref:AMMECR1 domain-containing protein n=1 Tax=Eremothecium cymbalariae (strain CBS 270.75 / DBVPG 7215 / KCTC 17166 / NRRL Y-17582) TaxID=931890 RepID=G8JVG0_ERECY|nr:hypothetical protein Ecym_6257 [Eremothecium cymbalariae DBVPG\